MLAGIPRRAIGLLCSLFGLLAVSKGCLGLLLLGHNPVQLIEIRPLRLLSELSASGAETCESGELLFGSLTSFSGALLGLGHPLPCAVGEPLRPGQLPFQRPADLRSFRVLDRDFGKPVIRVQAQAHKPIAY